MTDLKTKQDTVPIECYKCKADTPSPFTNEQLDAGMVGVCKCLTCGTDLKVDTIGNDVTYTIMHGW